MQHISDLLVDLAVADLQEACAGLTGDEAISIIRAGNFQQSPVDAKHYLTVHVGDPEDASAWQDAFYGARGQGGTDFSFIQAPAATIGGGMTWWRRFTVIGGLFGVKTKLTRPEGQRVANLTRGRIERAIQLSARLRGVTDSLGETALLPLVVSSYAGEGGGPPNSFIWRLKVRYQVLTEQASS